MTLSRVLFVVLCLRGCEVDTIGWVHIHYCALQSGKVFMHAAHIITRHLVDGVLPRVQLPKAAHAGFQPMAACVPQEVSSESLARACHYGFQLPKAA
eukprot:scaffold45587_cov19-Tisochrysis_lutea.AAC.1